MTRVLLVGHYGRNNLGDDAMLEGIRRTIPDGVRLTVLAGRPLPQLRTAPERPWAFVQQLVRNDWIWFGGGTHIHDLGDNPRFVNRGLLKALVLFVSAKLLRRKIAFIGMGLGPIRSRWTRQLTGFMLERLDYLSVRDERSYEAASQCTERHRAQRTFDSCVALDPGSHSNRTEPFVLGMNVMPYFWMYHAEPDRDRQFVTLLAEAVLEGALALPPERRPRVRIFTFSTKPKESELAVIEVLATALAPHLETEVVPYQAPETTLRAIGRCHAFIGMRYHSAMMAYIHRLPQIVLSYHPKCTALAEEVALPDRAIAEVEAIEGETIRHSVGELLTDPDRYRADLPLDEAYRRFVSRYFPPVR